MAIIAGNDALASDFVSTSSGAGDSGKVALLASDGKQSRAFLKGAFGGTGADGALSISSGTTTINLGGAAVVTKNYTSISITGTAQLAFSNPHANGTIIILKSQGNVTITSSASPAINAASMGASAGNNASTTFWLQPTAGSGSNSSTGSLAAGGTGGTKVGASIVKFMAKLLTCGSSGGNGGAGVSGGGSSGAGGGASVITNGTSGGSVNLASGNVGGTGGTAGVGGGCLYIECAGAYNCSSILSVAGGVGGDASNGGSAFVHAAGGGGGGGGMLVVLYDTLTSDTGTYTVTGGSPGASVNSGGISAAGGTGFSLVAANTEFV